MLWGAHDASSHDANMLLYYFSLWQNRDSPYGLAVESPCTVPVRSAVAFCKDMDKTQRVQEQQPDTKRQGRGEGGTEERRGGGGGGGQEE